MRFEWTTGNEGCRHPSHLDRTSRAASVEDRTSTGHCSQHALATYMNLRSDLFNAMALHDEIAHHVLNWSHQLQIAVSWHLSKRSAARLGSILLSPVSKSRQQTCRRRCGCLSCRASHASTTPSMFSHRRTMSTSRSSKLWHKHRISRARARFIISLSYSYPPSSNDLCCAHRVNNISPVSA